MELTLHLPSAEAARLTRLPLLKPLRTGRARSEDWRVVWHDTPDRALATKGLTLAERNGTWRLERHRPRPAEPWPPAAAPFLEAEGDAPNRLNVDLPDGLEPAASFEGRHTTIPLSLDSEPVTLTLLDGMSRAGTAEHPAARLILEGPDLAVRAVLTRLNEVLTLSIPPDSLTMEALRLAGAEPPPAGRAGAPVLATDSVSSHAAFAHIVGHLTGVMLRMAPAVVEDRTGPEPVHQMRVAVRRARSALALFAPAIADPSLAHASGALRHLGHMLGPARDWDVFMTETLPPVIETLPRQAGLRVLQRAGTRHRVAAHAALNAWLTGPGFHLLTLDLACLAASAPPPQGETPPAPLPVFAAGVLRSHWKKVKNTGQDLAGLDDPGLHGFRLKAKRLRYAAEFFAALFPEKAATRFIRRLADLQEHLGIFNDSTVAEDLLRGLSHRPSYAAGLVLGFTAARGAGIRPKIAASWAKLRKRDPFWT